MTSECTHGKDSDLCHRVDGTRPSGGCVGSGFTVVVSGRTQERCVPETTETLDEYPGP